MYKVKIYGAGSIGNHLAQASRRMGWDVVLVDKDKAALERTKTSIYPTRYGVWDDTIELFELGSEPKGGFDIIIVGTPPDVRMKVAIAALDEEPKALLLEKPLCPPSLEGVEEFEKKLASSGTVAFIGYDHVVSKAISTVQEIMRKNDFGKPVALDVDFRETWKGIFNAHPWLSGPEDTYLGFWKKGGGASGEHSHAANLWQHLARTLGLGEVTGVSAVMSMVKNEKVEYDQACYLQLVTDTGFVGRVAQDVVTEPVRKSARVQFTDGFVEVLINGWEGGDLIRYGLSGKPAEEVKIEKKRPDDFYEEVQHIAEVLEGKVSPKDSPIEFSRGLATAKVIKAAHESREQEKVVKF